MERRYLISEEGTFYKANLHCHTTVSDGCLSPAEVKELYQRHGYSIVAFTDHNTYVYHKELASEDFLPLAGYEANNDGRWSAGKGGASHPVTSHLNALAIDPEKASYVERPAVYDIGRINEMIAKMRQAGFLVNYNHPSWSAEHMEDILRLEGITCFEVYNHGAEMSCGNGCGDQQYDLWLKSGKRAFAIAADDNHNFAFYEGTKEHPGSEFDACGGFTMIKARTLSYPDVMEAIQAGNMYASNGPLIHALYVENDKLCVDSSPVCGIFMKDCSIGNPGMAVAAEDTLTHAEFSLEPVRKNGGGFVRLVLQRRDGKRAWTSAYEVEA